MNKQEILEFINYKGKYNKEVKTKLNKLIKKYHPDKNKNDKETILILYEVKKELEEGKKLEYNEESIKSEEKIERTNPFFIERIIKILKQRKRFVQKELNNLYKRSYYYLNKIYKESYDKGLLDIKIEELDNNIKYIKKIDNIEIMIILIVIIIIFITIITKMMLLLLLIIIPFILEIYYLNSKNHFINDTTKLIEKLKNKRQDFIDREKEYNKNVEKIRKREVELEHEIKSINNDIAYYNHELSKTNNKTNKKEYENVEFTKRSR